MKSSRFFEMRDVVRPPQVAFYSTIQRSSLGRQLAIAIGEGRGFEIRQEHPEDPSEPIVLLVTPADDLGHVYEIDRHGLTEEVGVTEVVARG